MPCSEHLPITTEHYKDWYICRSHIFAASSAPSSIEESGTVLVAANVDYNITQSNLPKYDTDRLNKYIMSENYSLAAITSSIPDSPSIAATPTTKPWHPDSASTFSITDNIEDLHRPKKLPSPIPITWCHHLCYSRWFCSLRPSPPSLLRPTLGGQAPQSWYSLKVRLFLRFWT